MHTPTQINEVTGAPKRGGYRPEIDGLRAIAVIAVIANHFNENLLPGGYLGVDVFFVISGYVITLSLSKTRLSDIWSFSSNFFKRRVKRLAPALFTCIAITAVAACLFNDKTASHINTGISALIGMSNIYLHSISTDYFADSTKLNPFTQTWSLGIEEQFYLIFPWLAWWFWLKNPGQKRDQKTFILIISALFTGSLIIYLALAVSDPSASYFLLPSRLWELSAGCLTFLLIENRGEFKPTLKGYNLSYLPLICLLVIFCVNENQQALTLTAVGLTTLVLAAPRNNPSNAGLKAEPLVYVGLASYSLYLWHWSVLSISRWTIGISLWSSPFQIALIGALGIASYELIEKRTRNTSWDPPFLVFFCSFAGLTLSTSLALSWLGRPHSRIFTGIDYCKAHGIETCKPKSEPHVALTPYLEDTTINRENCIIRTEKESFSEQVIQNCISQDSRKNLMTIHLVGDSLAGNLSPILNNIHKSGLANAAVLVKYACRLDAPPKDSNEVVGASSCEAANQQRLRYLDSRVNQGDIILIASSDTRLNESLKNAHMTLAALAKKKGAHVIAMTPPPDKVFPDSSDSIIQQCINSSSQWFNGLSREYCRAHYKQNLETFREEHQDFIAFLRKLESNHQSFHVWDVSKDLCFSGQCPSHKNGVRLYRDLKHFSLPATQEFLYPSFLNLLESKGIKLS